MSACLRLAHDVASSCIVIDLLSVTGLWGVTFHSIIQDKNQIEFLTENKRKLQKELEEECEQLRKDKIKLTGEADVISY